MLALAMPPSYCQSLGLLPGQPIDNLMDHMVLIAGAQIDLSTPEGRADAARRLDQGAARHQPLPFIVPGGSWMAVALLNRGKTSGEWLLDTEMPVWAPAEAFLVTASGAHVILRAGSFELKFSERIVPARLLASPPFTLGAGEQVQIWIRVDAAVATKNPVRLATAESSVSSRVVRAHSYGVYAGAGLLIAMFLLVFSFVLRFKPALHFALFLLSLVATNLIIEGFAFAHIHPEIPGLYIVTSMLGRAVTAVFYLQFIRSFLSTGKNYARYDRVIRWFLVAVVAGAAWTIVDLSVAALLAVAMAILVFIGLVAWGLYVGVRDKVRGARLFALGSLVFLGASLMMVSGGFSPLPLGIRQANDITIFLNLLDGIIFATAVVAQAFGLRRERDAALTAELAASQEQLRLSQALLTAERDRDQARRLADGHRERLAATSHDLRQPLNSLKLALAEVEAASPAFREKLHSGLEYLNTVLTDTLADSRPVAIGAAPGADELEAVPIQVIFDNLARMFTDEARAKGLRLDFVRSAAIVTTNPVTLIRCLSNLVANAIRYTLAGRVLVGVRQTADGARVEVWDTGPGLDESTLGRVMRRYERGTADGPTDGEGLGLAIVSDLAGSMGWRLLARSRPGCGSVFAIVGLLRATSGTPVVPDRSA